MIKFEVNTYKVISYYDIPESISKTCSLLQNVSYNVFVEFGVTSKEEQANFDDDFTLHNWLLSQDPDLAGEKILIHIDY